MQDYGDDPENKKLHDKYEINGGGAVIPSHPALFCVGIF
jgi:hypothetical protein